MSPAQIAVANPVAVRMPWVEPTPSTQIPRAAEPLHVPECLRPPDKLEERDVEISLMRRVAARDEVAFAELFHRCSPLLMGLLTRMLGGTAEAEEVLQEVFLRVWEKAESYRPERSTPRGWLVVMARSRALDRVRSRSSRRLREEATHAERQRLVAEGEPTVVRRIEHQERRRGLSSALERLPCEQRQALELAFFDGLTHSELAARLDIPLGTAKSRILLALRKLRRLLRSDVNAQPPKARMAARSPASTSPRSEASRCSASDRRNRSAESRV